jgi:hypothetical protein
VSNEPVGVSVTICHLVAELIDWRIFGLFIIYL